MSKRDRNDRRQQEKQESCLSCNILLLLSKNSRVLYLQKKTGATGDNKKNKNLVTPATSCFSCLKNSRVSVCLKETGTTGDSRKNKHLVTPATSCYSCLKEQPCAVCLKRQERQETAGKTRILSLLQYLVTPVKKITVCCISKKDSSDKRQQKKQESCLSCNILLFLSKITMCLYV